jgi:2-C-methyl-D-erythritol 4-phosphate cytidylyltransferase
MEENEGTVAVIVAGGSGRRFGGPKQMATLRGKPLLYWVLEAFQKHAEVDAIVLVLKPELIAEFRSDGYSKLKTVIPGGSTRQESVEAGLNGISRADLVLIHDGSRPFPGPLLISRVIAAARKSGAAFPGISLEDTLKEIQENGRIRTVDRDLFVRSQTPQGFRFHLLKTALKEARNQRFRGTDDVSLVERLGLNVEAVAGERKNIKITTSWDLRLAEVLFDL